MEEMEKDLKSKIVEIDRKKKTINDDYERELDMYHDYHFHPTLGFNLRTRAKHQLFKDIQLEKD